MNGNNMEKPTVISTFAGCGGSSLGYKMAGFKELLAIDFDKNSVDTFKLNFPNVEIWQKDIKEVSSKDILDFCKLKVGELDILDGSPPCQGFSMAGKRKITDLRNDLFLEFTRLIDELQPKVFVMENVPGQIRGVMKGKYNEIREELGKLNYQVKAKLMNAKYYNVPQSRERVFYIGVRNDLNKKPIFPIPNNKIITTGVALHDIKPETNILLTTTEIKYWIKLLPGEAGSKIDPKGNWFGFRKLDPNNPAPTIIKSAGSGLCHWNELRHFSYNELAVLSSFPIDFSFTGSESERIDRIGNAVMPNMMKAIAITIKEKIL